MWDLHRGALKYAMCYCSYKICKGSKRRRLIITKIVKHCRLYGLIEGRDEYHQLVSFSLYVFLFYIVFVDAYILNVEYK